MTDLSASAFFELASSRRGHFEMESGYHSARWLDLDALFADSRRMQPWVDALAAKLRPYRVDVVCGPLLGGAFLAQSVARVLDAEFWYTEAGAPRDGDGLYRARYRLPAAFDGRRAQARVALVDDVMSAGSSLRATHAEIVTHGFDVVATGALLVLGSAGLAAFAEARVPVEAVARGEFEMWAPADCPLCAKRVLLERIVSNARPTTH